MTLQTEIYSQKSNDTQQSEWLVERKQSATLATRATPSDAKMGCTRGGRWWSVPPLQSDTAVPQRMRADIQPIVAETEICRTPLAPVELGTYRQALQVLEIGRRVALGDGFRAGMDNAFRTAVHEFLRTQSVWGVASLKLAMNVYSAEVQAQLLLYVGAIEHEYTRDDRVWFAVAALESKFAEVRDAAGLALVDLGCPLAVPYLKAAINREPSRSLKKDLEQALRYLKHV